MEKQNKNTKSAKAAEKPAVKKAKNTSLDLTHSDETLHLANDVAKFIKENKLYQNVQGKEYVNVEAWQYAGSRLGITPIIEHLINIGDGNELKYQAKVTLMDLNKNVQVGAGFAICSNKEQGKKYYQEYAIASMAQTRAVGKAFRNILSWIIRAAGYEPTPAEEMDYNTNNPEPQKQQAKDEPVQAPAKKEPAKAEETKTAVEVKYASAKQKEEIIRLLNTPVITRPEKTKMLLNINKLDETRAAQAIEKLKKVIEEREGETAANGAEVEESEHMAVIRNVTDNLQVFDGLFSEKEFENAYNEINTTADLKAAKESKKKIYNLILERIGKERAGLKHTATKEQLDYIDKLLLSHSTSIEQKNDWNTLVNCYTHQEAITTIDKLKKQLDATKQKQAA